MATSEFIEIAAIEDIPTGHAARVEIDGVPIAIFNVNGTFYAVDDTCTHAEAYLSEGELDSEACTVECPLHGSSFNLTTGDPLSLPAVEPVRVHRVVVENGMLRVAINDA